MVIFILLTKEAVCLLKNLMKSKILNTQYKQENIPQNTINYMTYMKTNKFKIIMDTQSKMILSLQPKLYYSYLSPQYINFTEVI